MGRGNVKSVSIWTSGKNAARGILLFYRARPTMRHFLVHIIIVCCFLRLPAAAGTTDFEPAHKLTIQAYPLHGDSATTVIPFSMAGNLILVKAKVDSTEGNFIFDTGAPNLVLNIIYFRDYPVTQNHDAEQTSINGATNGVIKTSVTDFRFGSLEYNRLEADLVDLGHIENNKGVKVLGLLGMELFRQCELIIDYEKNLIYLHRIGRKESSSYKNVQLEDKEAYTVVPIDLTDNRIIATLEMGGKKLKFVIDYAAESNVLDSRLSNKVFENVNITGRIMLGGSGASRVEALKGDMKGLKIGDQSFATLPVVVTRLEKSCFAYAGCVDGVLGFDFLVLHKIGFNFVNRKMYIWK